MDLYISYSYESEEIFKDMCNKLKIDNMEDMLDIAINLLDLVIYDEKTQYINNYVEVNINGNKVIIND